MLFLNFMPVAIFFVVVFTWAFHRRAFTTLYYRRRGVSSIPCINVYSSLGVNQPAIVVLNSRYIWCIYKYNNKRRSPTNVYNNMSIIYVYNRVSTAVFAVCPVDPARSSLSPGGCLGPPRAHIILCSCFALYAYFHILLDCL